MADNSSWVPVAAFDRVIASLPQDGTGPKGRELFVRLLLASSDAMNLADLDAGELASHAVEAFSFLEMKPTGQHKIALRRATLSTPENTPATHVLEILNDDMPFLLDSVMGEIQARGITVSLVLHPIFKTSRKPHGALVALTSKGDRSWNDGHQESYISVHMARLSDTQQRGLVDALNAILNEVRVAVADWKQMISRVERAIRELEATPSPVSRGQVQESIAFLRWLIDNHFTLLGARDFRLVGDAQTGELAPVDGTGLGLLRDPSVHVLRRGGELIALTPEVRRFFFQPNPLIITKANVVARVHRRVHMDYVGIKTYGADGNPAGELRLIGLFTSTAYTQPTREIPLLRHKVERAMQALGAPPESHAGKALLNILETFPRDELVQIGGRDLEQWARGILSLETHPRLRVFARTDRFDRFVSILAYIPRDRYSSTVREKVGAYLAERFNGVVSAFYPHITDGPLVRVHFIIGRYEGRTPDIPVRELERGISAIVRTWNDQLADRLEQAEGGAGSLAIKYGEAFSAGYAETFSAERALEDIRRIERLGSERPVAIDFYRDPGMPEHRVRAAVYRFDTPIRLSERVPVLENLGFTVIDERSYRVMPQFEAGKRVVVLHDMMLETVDGSPLAIGNDDKQLENTFLAVLKGAAENDAFNRLVVAAGADWREAAILRSYAAFLRQIGSAFGLRYVADTVVRHAGIARDLLDLFGTRFDPERSFDPDQRRTAEASIRAGIEGALANVPSLDEDRILRHLLTVISATVRTNFYQRSPQGESPETIAFKLSSRDIDIAPEPRPYREVWISSPRVEGVHLRFAPIARGGIRWSDRALDFRTEVLGLAKAQQVKNAVIVPAGAKGGFLPKLLPRSGSREDIQKEGIAAYSIFISALLDITDNIKDGAVVPPERVVRHDGDDPYFVVAADKGTATFSDTANAISAAHGFWLGDAFASGGSVGYDHKKIGITARGAWECVKRHFREMDRNIQTEPFRVVGVGDMSGDVFGNGMLQSPETRLVAAFDHRDIFLDPEPDAAASYSERKRLFDLPRSSWADYDKTKISKGGGVFSRSSKSIVLSEEARAFLKVSATSMTPMELMHAILGLKVDLLWFGGIGTYVRASSETDLEVGDRANDPIRITAADVRALVIGEGANLGVTQRARVEFSTRGGRINADFIDNSAGVNTSDQEVNIKIALGPASASGQLDAAGRKRLLFSMTDDVAAAVLRNNYQQSLALSLSEREAVAELGANARLVRTLEGRGLLDRQLEALPTDREIADHQRTGRGLVRPELAILSSYAKISLLHDLLASPVPDERYMEGLLFDYFPEVLQKSFGDGIRMHRLRREIIATTLTNGLVNRLGAPTPLRLSEETARPVGDVAHAFMASRAIFGLADLWRRIDALDGRLDGKVQLGLYARVRRFVVGTTALFMRDGSAASDLTGTIERQTAGLSGLKAVLDQIAMPSIKARIQRLGADFAAQGVPPDLAADISDLDVIRHSPAVVNIAQVTGRTVGEAARIFLEAGERFKIDEITARARSIRLSDDYDQLAIAGAESALADARQHITLTALRTDDGKNDGLTGWRTSRAERFEHTERELADIAASPELTVSRLSVAAARLSDLART